MSEVCPKCGSRRVKRYGANRWVCQDCDCVFPLKVTLVGES